MNLYAYAGNNPVAFTDPFGLQSCCSFGFVDPRAALGAVGSTSSHSAQAATEAVVRNGVTAIAFGLAAGIASEASGSVESEAGVRTDGAVTATRYVGSREAATIAQTGIIPNRNASNEPRVIHYTTDNPTSSASNAMTRYGLDVKPTHMVQFSGADVGNTVTPLGRVASDATQAATSRTIVVSGAPIPLGP